MNYELDEFICLSIEQLQDSGIQFSFPNISFLKPQIQKPAKTFSWNTFPISYEEYEPIFRKVQQEMFLGNTYLANLTCKTPVESTWSLEDFFHSSQAKYKILFPGRFVCFSPETFVEVHNGSISTQPMKGTIDADIPNAAEVLKHDPKELAEHYTVVDLLRNDLNRVATHVEVKEFQNISEIRTHRGKILGMSSLIEGRLKVPYSENLGSMLKELLPAGSILGAPKKRTQEIIAEAEGEKRGFYTGIAGYYDGVSLDTCVMIRFIEQEEGKLYFRSGGGITYQSDCLTEYEEMKAKIYVPIS